MPFCSLHEFIFELQQRGFGNGAKSYSGMRRLFVRSRIIGSPKLRNARPHFGHAVGSFGLSGNS
jgi:hypothetical protein